MDTLNCGRGDRKSSSESFMRLDHYGDFWLGEDSYRNRHARFKLAFKAALTIHSSSF